MKRKVFLFKISQILFPIFIPSQIHNLVVGNAVSAESIFLEKSTALSQNNRCDWKTSLNFSTKSSLNVAGQFSKRHFLFCVKSFHPNEKWTDSFKHEKQSLLLVLKLMF